MTIHSAHGVRPGSRRGLVEGLQMTEAGYRVLAEHRQKYPRKDAS